MSESKSEQDTESKTNAMSKVLQWDISVNADKYEYSNNNTFAKTTTGKSTIRTNFFEKGRHVIKIKLNNCGNTGIGIVTKSFQFGKDVGIGNDGNSWGIYKFHGGYYQKKSKIATDRSLTLTGNEIITVDINMDKNTINWAINGMFLSNKNIPLGTSEHIALAASLWNKGDSVQIVQYDVM